MLVKLLPTLTSLPSTTKTPLPLMVELVAPKTAFERTTALPFRVSVRPLMLSFGEPFPPPITRPAMVGETLFNATV